MKQPRHLRKNFSLALEANLAPRFAKYIEVADMTAANNVSHATTYPNVHDSSPKKREYLLKINEKSHLQRQNQHAPP
jgi:hypothetical protein